MSIGYATHMTQGFYSPVHSLVAQFLHVAATFTETGVVLFSGDDLESRLANSCNHHMNAVGSYINGGNDAR